jgi:hypothetical protein
MHRREAATLRAHRSEVTAQLEAGETCQFLGVYLRDQRPPLYTSCDSSAEYAAFTVCCGKRIVLCTRHVKAAKQSEWSECTSCVSLATNWEHSMTEASPLLNPALSATGQSGTDITR